MEQGCIEWEGCLDKAGYGVTTHNGKWQRAHRAAWLRSFGPIPAGMVVRHMCDNRACVNHEHLILGTQAENIKDRDSRGRKAVQIDPWKLAGIYARDLMGPTPGTAPNEDVIGRRQVAREYGVSGNTVLRVRRRGIPSEEEEG